MGKDSKISWCDDSWNPWIGCTKVSPGCDHCYAEALDARHRWGGATHWGAGVPRKRTAESNWNEPLVWNRQAGASGKRRLVFCASLADVFDNEVPEAWRLDLWKMIDITPNLTWLLLTKRIGNAAKMLRDAWPQFKPAPNVWIGASVVNQEEADRDIPKLLQTPAAKRFVSYEPVLGPILWRDDYELATNHWLRGTAKAKDNLCGGSIMPIPKIDWVIVGGESGGSRRTMAMGDARSTIRQCKAAGVPVFVKQDSSFFPGQQGRFTDEEFALKEFPS